MVDKPAILTELQEIPGVGKSISRDLYDLGITSVARLKDKNPEKLYIQLCNLRRRHIDRCVLYTFRCAVYYASHKKHQKKLLDWWAWKDTY